MVLGERHNSSPLSYKPSQGKSSGGQQDSSISAPPAMAGGPPATELNGLVADIVGHGETLDSHYASHSYEAMRTVDTESFHKLGASLYLKIQSLPILDNLVSSFPQKALAGH